jgi:hypothetical protein
VLNELNFGVVGSGEKDFVPEIMEYYRTFEYTYKKDIEVAPERELRVRSYCRGKAYEPRRKEDYHFAEIAATLEGTEDVLGVSGFRLVNRMTLLYKRRVFSNNHYE